MAECHPQPSWGREEFLTTHWTTIFTAGQEQLPAARQALERVCATYWYPLYAYVRRQGHQPADAQDLTQDFFARFLERRYVKLADPARGRFRTFLLTSLKHFLVNEWNKASCLKRNGGWKPLSLDEERCEERFAAEPAVEQAPDMTFDKGWATSLMEHALAQFRQEVESAGKDESFEQLKGFVWAQDAPAGYPALAERLGITEGALKVKVHRLRRRFRMLLHEEVAQTVARPDDVEQELRYLIAVLRQET